MHQQSLDILQRIWCDPASPFLGAGASAISFNEYARRELVEATPSATVADASKIVFDIIFRQSVPYRCKL